MRIAGILRLTFGAAAAGGFAIASPVTYTMMATATGTFAGVAFTNAAITVTSTADTGQVVVTPHPFPSGDVYDVIAISSSISIAGFPTATFTDPMFWEDPQGLGDIVFGDAVAAKEILGLTKVLSGLESYDLKSSFGPVFSNFDFVTSFCNGFQKIPTNAGDLSLVAGDDTFTAVTAAPEPASFLATALGLLGLIAVRRHFPRSVSAGLESPDPPDPDVLPNGDSGRNRKVRVGSDGAEFLAERLVQCITTNLRPQ